MTHNQTTLPHEIIDVHRPAFTAAVGRIAAQLFSSEALHAGEDTGVSWHTHEQRGKQQPVAITGFEFPNGETVDAVVRPTDSDFAEIYQEFDSVRTYFPKLFATTAIPDTTGGNRKIVAMEKLEGFHFDLRTATPTMREFQELLDDPEKFEQLCTDMFEMADAILHDPLTLGDIRPTVGHNIMYNTKTGRFQPFDVDTVSRSDMSHLEKFLDFVSPGQKVDSDKEVAYIARMMKYYQAKYPGVGLHKESPETTRTTYVIPDTDDAPGLLRPTSSGYMQAYMVAINPFGTQGNVNLPNLAPRTTTGKEITTLKPDILQAISDNDLTALKDLLNENRGYLTETIFAATEVE